MDVGGNGEIRLERAWVGRKLPPSLLIKIVVFAPVAVIGFYQAGLIAQQWGAAFIGSGIIAAAIFVLYLNDRGYQLSTDAERIYLREAGLVRRPERSMTYDEIALLEGKFAGDAHGKSLFVPFEYLELSSSNPDVEPIRIYPPAFRDRAIKDFLLDFHARRPEIFPDYVLSYMRSERSL